MSPLCRRGCTSSQRKISMQIDIHARWLGDENEKHLKALRKWAKRERKALAHYMIEATKEKMKRDGISP